MPSSPQTIPFLDQAKSQRNSLYLLKAAIVNENVTATPALDQLRDVVAKQKVEGSVRKLKTPAVYATIRFHKEITIFASHS